MEKIEKFIRERASKTKRKNSNCVGTALYLVGESDTDKYLDRYTSRDVLLNFRKSFCPQKGYFVCWMDGTNPFHVGVVLETNPLTILHRDGCDGYLKSDSFDELNLRFKNIPVEIVYKIPNNFEKILGGKD